MKRFAAALAVIALTAVLAAAQDANPVEKRSARRWLVKFEPDATDSAQEFLARIVGARIERLGPYADFVLLTFARVPAPRVMEILLNSPSVVWVEREVRFATAAHATLAREDPLEYLQWSHRMIRLAKAHYVNFGSDPGVTIAVLDTGIAYLDAGRFAGAPDLAGTIILPGYDFVSEDDLALDEGDGKIGHGTFMAGVIAQTTHNSWGTAGIAFNASLLPVRVADRRGISRSTDLARGIRFAVANGAGVIFIGVAGPHDSAAIADAVRFAYENGVAVIAPAGNNGDIQFPARYREVLSVGAVDASGRRAYYSPTEGPVDIYAPGGDMRQGVDVNADGRPDGVLAESFTGRRFDRFTPVYAEGTSVSAAHVAGTAALLLSQTGSIHPERLYRAVRSSARSIGGIPILDAAKLLMRTNAVSF